MSPNHSSSVLFLSNWQFGLGTQDTGLFVWIKNIKYFLQKQQLHNSPIDKVYFFLYECFPHVFTKTSLFMDIYESENIFNSSSEHYIYTHNIRWKCHNYQGNTKYSDANRTFSSLITTKPAQNTATGGCCLKFPCVGCVGSTDKWHILNTSRCELNTIQVTIYNDTHRYHHHSFMAIT